MEKLYAALVAAQDQDADDDLFEGEHDGDELLTSGQPSHDSRAVAFLPSL